MTASTPIAALGRTAVPGDLPAGRSAVDDPEFELLRAEVLKDPVRETTDWSKVVPVARELLESRSKDFTVAGYLAVGLLETRGYAGLAEGIEALVGMLECFWDQGFPPVPKRLRGRANTFQWMMERCSTWIERRGAEVQDRPALIACVETGTELDKQLAQRFPEGDVGAGALLRALREQLERLPAPSADPVAAGEPSIAVSASAPPAPSAGPAAAVAPGELEIRSQADAQLLVFRVAGFLRDKERTSPTPYRLVRAFRWSGVTSSPAATEGKTPIVPPASDTVARLQQLLGARDWAGLLEEAESAFREGSPLWLDLQRFSATALEALGDAYRDAREAVLAEIRALLRRLPALPELRFRDDTPFADPETRAWLAEVGASETAPASPAASRASSPPADGNGEALERARGEARRFAKDGDLRSALKTVSEALAATGSPRLQFLARLEVATLCAELGRDRIAMPMLEGLDELARRHGLEEWEPELATRALEALYRSTRRVAGQRGAPASLAGRVEELFARLCRIDPAAAAGID